MKIAGGLIFFDDCKSLERCLPSLINIDTVFCIDGRFAMYDCTTNSDLSTDGSRELVLSYPNTVLVDYPGVSEVDKRNKYLQLAKNYDWLLIIDSDEYVIEFDRLQLAEIKEGNIFCINFNNLGHPTIAPRLWRKPYEMEYLEAHNIFRKRGTGQIQRSTAGGPIIEGIAMASDDSLRTRDREAAATAYQVKLIAQEKAIKFKYGFRSSPL